MCAWGVMARMYSIANDPDGPLNTSPGRHSRPGDLARYYREQVAQLRNEAENDLSEKYPTPTRTLTLEQTEATIGSRSREVLDQIDFQVRALQASNMLPVRNRITRDSIMDFLTQMVRYRFIRPEFQSGPDRVIIDLTGSQEVNFRNTIAAWYLETTADGSYVRERILVL